MVLSASCCEFEVRTYNALTLTRQCILPLVATLLLLLQLLLLRALNLLFAGLITYCNRCVSMLSREGQLDQDHYSPDIPGLVSLPAAKILQLWKLLTAPAR